MHLQELIKIIKERRKILKVNQKELAELSEIGLRTVKGLESGKSNPTLKTVISILDVLGMELSIITKK